MVKPLIPKTYVVVYEVEPHPKDSRRSAIYWNPVDLTMPRPFTGKVELASSEQEISIINLPDYGGEWLNSLTVSCVSARDWKRIALALSGKLTSSMVPSPSLGSQPNGMMVYVTSDGGATWTGIDGTNAPTAFLQGHHAPGWVTTIAGELFGFADFGCFHTGWSYPIDKGFCRRLMFTDEEKWWMSPYYFVDPHGQHCINQQCAVMDRNGRIWTAWTQPGINGTDLCLSWSGDGGATWHGCQGDGKLPRVPGMPPGAICLVPYGQGVAVFSRKGPELAMWRAFDGETWTEPKKYPSVYGQQLLALSDDEIYLCAPTYDPAKIMRFDGKGWTEELKLTVKGSKELRITPHIAVLSKTVLCFILDTTRTKLLCYRKADGKWSDATELVRESTPIVAFTAQMYAPDDFVPVAYMCAEEEQKVQEELKLAKKPSEARAVLRIKPWVKLLKIPVRR